MDGRSQGDESDASDEAKQYADLLLCLYTGGGMYRLFEEGIIDEGAKNISTLPGLGYFNEMRYSYHC